MTFAVLDTSALIDDPESLLRQAPHDVVLPLTVLEELDHLKDRDDFVGAAARSAIRLIEEIRQSGDLREPVPLSSGGTLRIEVNGLKLAQIEELGLERTRPDNRILAAALGLTEHGPVQLLSADISLRIKAAQLGLQAITPPPVVQPEDTPHPGWETCELDPDTFAELHDTGRAPAAAAGDSVVENVGLVARCGTSSALARCRGGEIVRLRTHQEAWGLRPKNKEQRFALDLLLDPDVGIVALSGPAGTGKTILALAAALEQVVEQRTYNRILILRPLVSVERQELGFLPGTVEEKLSPWFEAVVDTLVALSDKLDHRECRALIEQLTSTGQLAMEPVTFLRGRSLQKTLVIADEVQNLSRLSAKTIVSRIGAGSKVVLLGDPGQIDAPYLSRGTEALSSVIAAFAGDPLFGWTLLRQGERSAIADLAARKL